MTALFQRARARLRVESGYSLPELLIASVLMVVVLSATLSVLDASSRNARRTSQLKEQQDRARQAIDFLTRDLRSIAASDPGTPGIERRGDFDLVFTRIAPRRGAGSGTRELQRVRYCLDQVTPNPTLWREAWSPSATLPTSCLPNSGYLSRQPVGETVVNRRDNLNRAVFTYDSTNRANVSYVGARLFVDLNVNDDERPPEVAARSSVFLRNQNLGTRNRAPTADFSATAQGGRHVLLNGGTSSDPDGQTLQYEWFVDGSRVATGPVLDYTAPEVGPRSFSLRVTDDGSLTGTDEQTVTVL